MAAAPATDLAAQAYTDALEGRLAMAEAQPAAARSFFERAIQSESQRAAPLRLCDWYLLLAQVDPGRRDQDVQAAYAALQGVRAVLLQTLRDPVTGESTFELHMRPVFEAAVDVELGAGAIDAASIRQAQQIVEAYRQAELENYFGNACTPPRTPIKPSQLRAGEVVLYPVLLNDRVELLYAAGSEGGIFKRLTPNREFNAERVTKLVNELRASLSRPPSAGQGPPAWQDSARTLYNLLIAPIESKLDQQSTLVVLPDGALRLLPFDALLDRSGHFLVERTRLVIAPALAYSQPGLDRQGPAATIAAGTLDKPVTFNHVSYPALFGGEAEAQAAAASRAANGKAGYLIPILTEPNLVSTLASGRFERPPHLATHAAFNVSSGERLYRHRGRPDPADGLASDDRRGAGARLRAGPYRVERLRDGGRKRRGQHGSGGRGHPGRRPLGDRVAVAGERCQHRSAHGRVLRGLPRRSVQGPVAAGGAALPADRPPLPESVLLGRLHAYRRVALMVRRGDRARWQLCDAAVVPGATPGRRRWLLGSILSSQLLIISPAAAQVVTHVVADTVAGRSVGTLVKPGPSGVTIDGGTLAGGNLFESFSQFSLAAGDTAAWTYSFGDATHIQNVINRVTGGVASQIDGTIDSTGIPNANFFFINPAGVVFGAGARINVPAAAYFSTASALRFADGASYTAVTASGSKLTVAPPAAFGFLGGEGDMAADGVGSSFFAGSREAVPDRSQHRDFERCSSKAQGST